MAAWKHLRVKMCRIILYFVVYSAICSCIQLYILSHLLIFQEKREKKEALKAVIKIPVRRCADKDTRVDQCPWYLLRNRESNQCSRTVTKRSKLHLQR